MHPSSFEPHALLGPDDGPAWSCINPSGGSPFLLIGDHTGNRVPSRLGTLGLSQGELDRHIGWDIGVAALGEALARRLDAVFLAQRFSRLVIDCNRDPEHADAIPQISDGTPIPGNDGLTSEDRAERVRAIHTPYHEAIAARIAARPRTILVSLHSFTPVMAGRARPWDVGVLHDGANDVFACHVLATARGVGDVVVGDNEPYRMDATDYTVPRHAFASGLAYVELEVRQDRLTADVEGWAERLATVLEASDR